jgi:hypothetical protein
MSTPGMARLASWTLGASAVAGAVGAVFLVLMYALFGAGDQAAGQAAGRINDTLAIASYLLLAPTIVVLHGRLRRGTVIGRSETLLGVVGAGGIVVLQGLLVADVLTFEQQIGPVTVAFLVLGAWFVLTDRRARTLGPWPNGGVIGVLAALYFGYPVWAYRVARVLIASPGAEAAAPGVRQAET